MKRLVAIGLSLVMLVCATSVNALYCGFGHMPDMSSGNTCVKDPTSRWWVYQRLEKRLADYKYEIQKIEALMGLLEYKICIGCDVAGEDLSGVNIWRVNLQGANLEGVNLSKANLEEANLSGGYLRHADLSDADLNHANLAGANLAGANLAGANLHGASLVGASLRASINRKTNLDGADLTKAVLTGANLTGVRLEGTIFCNTTMPDDTENNSDCPQDSYSSIPFDKNTEPEEGKVDEGLLDALAFLCWAKRHL